MASEYGAAVEQLAVGLDALQDKLGREIEDLAGQINTLAGSSGSADVSITDGVRDGDVVRQQYMINQMTKAAETGASIFTKAEGVSKSVGRTLNQA